MKRTTSLFIAASCLPLASCGDWLANAFGALAALDKVCVTGFKGTVKPQLPGAATGSADFQAVFTNPQSSEAKGSIEMVMGVTARGVVLGQPAATISAEAKPGFAMPADTVYPPGTQVLSPVAINVAHDRFVRYDIEIYTHIPGSEYDGTPCHTFRATNVELS